MKVTLTKNLNVRVGKPGLNAPSYQNIKPGDQIEVYELLYRGDEYEGIDKWFRDKAGNYYWYGSVDLKTILRGSIACVDYNSLINLPSEIKASRGKDITIGIVDSGCYNHPSLKENITGGYNALEKSSDFTDKSNKSHGTLVAGLIAAHDGKGNISETIGIAPEVKLVIVKVTEQHSIGNNQALLNGIEWLMGQNVNIINCSFDIYPGDLEGKFNDLFNTAASKNIILVGAGQDNEGLLNPEINYPARNTNFVTAGCLNQSVMPFGQGLGINSRINYLMEEIYIKSTANYGLYDYAYGSSFVTAMLSGVFALILSYQKLNKTSNLSPKELLDSLTYELSNPSQFTGVPAIFKNH
jgi:subtilisin family serine protease